MNQDEKTLSEIPLDEIVEIPSFGKKNVILDSQILTSLMACGRLTDFRFNLNLISLGGKSNSLECGSIMHKFLEVYYGSIIKGVSKDQALGFGLAAAELLITGCPHCVNFSPISIKVEGIEGKLVSNKPECGHQPNEYPRVQNTPKDSEDYKTGWQYVLDTCEQYHKYWKNDHWIPLEVEVVKGIILYEDEDIRILWKAKLDWVADTNQGIYPVDHKTMKQRRDTISLNNQFMGQCHVMKTRSLFINKIGFQKSLKPEEKFTREILNYSASRLFEWSSETVPYYAKLLLMYAETGHWPPNYTSCESKYGNCVFSKVCESDASMREEELKLNFRVGPVWNPSNKEEE